MDKRNIAFCPDKTKIRLHVEGNTLSWALIFSTHLCKYKKYLCKYRNCVYLAPHNADSYTLYGKIQEREKAPRRPSNQG